MRTTIYGLADPGGTVRYIGRTSRTLSIRLREHIKEALGVTDTYKTRWLRKLIGSGKTPIVVSLMVVDGDGAVEEIEQLRLYKAAGYSLVNSTEGGDGHMICTDTVRAKISAANKGKKPTAKNIEAVKRANTGRVPSPETRQRLSLSHKCHVVSAATRAKISARAKGRKPSASNQAALAAWRARGSGGNKTACIMPGDRLL